MSTADAFFETFKARVKQAATAEQAQRINELDDLRFEAGEHWSDKDVQDRKLAGKPSMTIDLLGPPIKQLDNQLRSSRPGIDISPVGNGADVETAERWQGVLRRIERLSRAHVAYCWAGWHQKRMGRGFWGLENIEVGEDGEQDIRIVEFENQHSILSDPGTKKLNGIDKRWAIQFEDITHEDYKERFDETKLAEVLSQGFSAGPGDSVPEWITSTHVRIGIYWYVEDKVRTRIVMDIPDGMGGMTRQAAYADELEQVDAKEGRKKVKVAKLPDGAVERRRVKKTKKIVHRCVLNGIGEKLEETIVPGEYIPIVMVYGERRYIDGKRDFRGMVRMNKHASMMEDWTESSLMEAISHAKTAPWLIAVGQIPPGQEQVWQRANTNPPQALMYQPIDVNGTPVQPPIRVPSGVDVSALTMAAQRMQNHVRAGTGMADTYQEETGSEQSKLSGVAFARRRQNQELGTSDYMDNIGEGIVLTAIIAMSMAREVYDTPRLMRILDAEDNELEIATHAGADQRAQAEQMGAQSKDLAGMLDVSVGEYDIVVTPGRDHATARQETVETVSQLPPEIIMAGSDIYVGMMDFPGSQEWAKRLKKANPLAQDEEEGAIPPQVQQQMQQAQTVIDQQTEVIHKLQDQVEDKNAERESKVAMSAADNQTTLQIEAAKLQLERERMQMDFELAKLKIEADLQKAQMAAAAAERQAERDDQARREGMAHEHATGAANVAAEKERAQFDVDNRPKEKAN